MSGISIGASFGGAMREETLTPITSMAMQRVNFPEGIDDDTANAMIPHIVGHRGAKITVAGATSNTTLKLKVAKPASMSYISVAGQNVLRANHGARLAQQLIDEALQNVLHKQKMAAKAARTSTSAARPAAASFKQPAASKTRNVVPIVPTAAVVQPPPPRKPISFKPPSRRSPSLFVSPSVSAAINISPPPRLSSTTASSTQETPPPKKRPRQLQHNVIEILDTPTRPSSPPQEPKPNKTPEKPAPTTKLPQPSTDSTHTLPKSHDGDHTRKRSRPSLDVVGGGLDMVGGGLATANASEMSSAVSSTTCGDVSKFHREARDYIKAHSMLVEPAPTAPEREPVAVDPVSKPQHLPPGSQPSAPGQSNPPVPSPLPPSALVAWTSTLQSSLSDVATLGSSYARLRKEYRAATRRRRLTDTRVQRLVAIHALAAHVPVPPMAAWHNSANDELFKVQRRMERKFAEQRCPSALLLPAFLRMSLVVPRPAPRLGAALEVVRDQLVPHPFQCLDGGLPDMAELSRTELLHAMQPNADLEETCHLHEALVASAAAIATNVHEFGLHVVQISHVLRCIVLHRAASKEWLYRGYGQHSPPASGVNAWQETFETWRDTVTEAVLPTAMPRTCHPLVQRTCDYYPYLLPSVLQWTSDMQSRGETKEEDEAAAAVLQSLHEKVSSLLLSCKMPFPRLLEHERLVQQHVKTFLVALAKRQVMEWAQLLTAHADVRELIETGLDDDGMAGVHLLPGFENPPHQLCEDDIPPCQTLPALAALAHQQARLSRRR